MISDEWLEDLKRKIDLVQLGKAHGVAWSQKGGRAVACCPFHDEKTPSFHALEHPKVGAPRFVCYGFCGRSWSAVSFLVDGFGREFLDAVEELAHAVGVTVPSRNETEAARRAREVMQNRRAEILRAIELAQQYFVAAFNADRPEAAAARAYVRGRGLWPAVAAWGIGFAPGTDGLVQWLGQNLVSVDLALEACLLGRNDRSTYPFFWDGRVTFPWRDRRGRVVAHVGRTMKPGHEPKYLNPREIDGVFVKGELVFGLDLAAAAIRETGEVIVVEGQISGIIPWIHGIRNGVACGGKAFAAAHARLLIGAGADRAVFLLDGDAAGRNGAEAAVETAFAEGLPARVAELGDGVDPDDYITAQKRLQWPAPNLITAAPMVAP